MTEGAGGTARQETGGAVEPWLLTEAVACASFSQNTSIVNKSRKDDRKPDKERGVTSAPKKEKAGAKLGSAPENSNRKLSLSRTP